MGRFIQKYLIVAGFISFILSTHAFAETLLIGGDAPLSGPAASWGLGQTRALEMLAEEINGKGGLPVGGKKYTLEILAYDNKAQASEATSIAKKLVFDKNVKYIMSAAVGATGRAIQTITAPNNVFFCFSCWGKMLLGPEAPYNFRNGHSPYELCDAYIAAVKKAYPNIKTIATFSPNDTSGWDAAKGVIAAAKSAGIECVAEEYFEREVTDFHSVLTRVLAKKPDMIELGGTPMSTGGVILKQAHEMGYKGAKGWLAGSNPSIATKIAGTEATEGLLLGVTWDYLSPKFTLPEMRELHKKYKAKYGEEWDYYGMCNYAGARIVFDSMVKANTLDVPAVVKTIIDNQPYKTFLGPTIYGNASVYGLPRNMIHPLVLGQVTQGKVTNISYGLHPDLQKLAGDWRFPE